MKAVAAVVATVITICGMWAGGWAIKTDLETHTQQTVQDESTRP